MESRWSVETAQLLMKGLDALPIGLVLFDEADHLTFCSSQLHKIFPSLPKPTGLVGCSFVELLTRIVENHDIAGAKGSAEAKAWVERRMDWHRRRERRAFEEQVSDGRWLRLERHAVASGAMLFLWQDVTRRRLLDMRIVDVADTSGQGLALWDQRDTLVVSNGQFADFFPPGSPAPRPGDHFEEVIVRLYDEAMPEENPASRIQVDSWRNAHRQPSGRTVIRRSDERWFLIKERRTRDGGTVSLVSDITELKKRGQNPTVGTGSLERSIDELANVQSKLQQQGGELADVAEELALARQAVEQADASKTRFLRSISHELRTPLNAIIGFSEVLRDGLLGPLGNPRYEEYVNDIHDSGTHLLSLVNQLLDLSRIEAGRYDLDLEPQDIGETVANSLRLVSKQIDDAGLYLVDNIPDDLPTIVADQQAVRQILVNLLSNAVKFTPHNGEIRIEAQAEKEAVVLCIVDSGIGIPPDKISRLMRPFERVDNSLERATEGTGLGLAISRSLAEMHGGSLELESGLGEGTKAILRLPLKGPDDNVHYFGSEEVGAA